MITKIFLLNTDMCTKDLMDDREKLEEQFHTIVRGMAYPFGTYDEILKDLRLPTF